MQSAVCTSNEDELLLAGGMLIVLPARKPRVSDAVVR